MRVAVDHDFPVAAKYEWRDWNPDTWQSTVTPFEQHPQAVDQSYLVNWNNKQAKAYRSADANAYSSTYRALSCRPSDPALKAAVAKLHA